MRPSHRWVNPLLMSSGGRSSPACGGGWVGVGNPAGYLRRQRSARRRPGEGDAHGARCRRRGRSRRAVSDPAHTTNCSSALAKLTSTAANSTIVWRRPTRVLNLARFTCGGGCGSAAMRVWPVAAQRAEHSEASDGGLHAAPRVRGIPIRGRPALRRSRCDGERLGAARHPQIPPAAALSSPLTRPNGLCSNPISDSRGRFRLAPWWWLVGESMRLGRNSEVPAALTSETRVRTIETVLKTCLSWTEWFSIVHASSSLTNRKFRRQVKGIRRAAEYKLAFLQDALVYSFLRHVTGCGPEIAFAHAFSFDDTVKAHPEFAFRSKMFEIVLDDVKYFQAIAIAKLFRAHVRTRSGDIYGFPWGSHFSYSRDSRKSVFQHRGGGIASGSGLADAAELGKRLLDSAQYLMIAYGECDSCQRDALRSAVTEGSLAENNAALRSAWKIGIDNGLPMDRLWDWSGTRACVYAERCIGYGEFYDLYVAHDRVARENDEDDLARRATERLQHLHNEEMRYNNDEKLVARNWWSRGFQRGMYSWTSKVNIKGNLHDDLVRLVNRINADETYMGVQKRFVPDAKEMVKAACKGEVAGQIMQLETLKKKYNMRTIYHFLFNVATENKSPKMQDCWEYW